ncbi:hypothetical protein R5H32_17045 [Defluviimonas sp. D31]|uniref:Uncharacterized protein n=1 Tax=Albidovulum salinarum TaxID=2984153 RepID=A0ABT2X9T5_9RHOB|nr:MULTISPECIES: hypothetical protein [unclassified Defluviimonas]MCU9849787.1 hypothetical protein [Defluviimonas sp. WL0024]MDW4551071.1 hypothetical protein [Defluviimonas sp. D31]
MAKFLVAGILILGLYALHDSQKPGSSFRLTPASAPKIKASSAVSGIGASAAGLAGRIAN